VADASSRSSLGLECVFSAHSIEFGVVTLFCQGIWRTHADWVPLEWVPRNRTHPYQWGRLVNDTMWTDLFEYAQARRYATLAKNELMCSFGNKLV